MHLGPAMHDLQLLCQCQKNVHISHRSPAPSRACTCSARRATSRMAPVMLLASPARLPWPCPGRFTACSSAACSTCMVAMGSAWTPCCSACSTMLMISCLQRPCKTLGVNLDAPTLLACCCRPSHNTVMGSGPLPRHRPPPSAEPTICGRVLGSTCRVMR